MIELGVRKNTPLRLDYFINFPHVLFAPRKTKQEASIWRESHTACSFVFKLMSYLLDIHIPVI